MPRADARDSPKSRDGRGLGVDDGVDRLVVEDAEGRLAVGDALAVGDELVAQRHGCWGWGVPFLGDLARPGAIFGSKCFEL